MPKREKSPEAPDDARYFTVHEPYPLNPNWAEEEDQRACAVWIAECIGPNHLWAIHNKPSSRNMILLEVSRDFEDYASLLGEHRWSEFLKDPTIDEKVRSTKVFHSFYSRGREARNDDWKIIVVQPKWFEDWAPGEDRIKHPYPSTHWCSTPVEDITNKPLCRPLPVGTKSPPPRAQSAVAGSSTWVAKQTELAPTQAALASAWSGGGAQVAQVAEHSALASGASSPYETMKPDESDDDDDDGNWGSLQGGASENWGVPADPFSGTTDNLDEVELHPWEGDTSVCSARDPPNATASELTQKFLKSLKCQAHNYHCNKMIYKDMARLVKEEEAKRPKGLTDSDRKGFPRDHNTLTVESSKRTPRKEKSEGGKEEGADKNSTADVTNTWGAPIGSKVEEWGVQISEDAWKL